MSGPVLPPPAPAMPPNLVRPPVKPRRRRKRRSGRPVIVIIIAAVVVLVVIVGAVVVLLKSSGIKTGSGTATLTWRVPKKGAGPSPKSYSGKVDGLTLTGKSTGVAPADAGKPTSGTGGPELPVAHWSGTLGGKKFDLNVTESIGSGPSSTTSNKYLGNFNITFHITGTYGTDAVKATATADPHHTGRLLFTGTVGSFHVKGTASEPKESATKGKIRASFVVTG
ncbi:MAG TPA: hypothetical protein VIJ09_11840 [Acidimicrobiales bacterium]